MFKGLRNIHYYFSEIITILKLNGLSSFLSLISLVLIFFITALTVSGWWMSHSFSDALMNQAEISVYYPQNLNSYSLETLKEDIQEIEGVKSISWVSAEEAYQTMSDILGQEAKILKQFDENPFEAYFEVSIELNQLEPVMGKLSQVASIEYVRDNRSVLEKIDHITQIIGIIGLIMIVAVGFATFLITSHIIREGVHAHRNQINTLQLLGAPDRFIHTPFVLEGILVTTFAGIISAGIFALFAAQFSQMTAGMLPFFPAMNTHRVIELVCIGLVGASAVLGLLSSLFGLKLIKNK